MSTSESVGFYCLRKLVYGYIFMKQSIWEEVASVGTFSYFMVNYCIYNIRGIFCYLTKLINKMVSMVYEKSWQN